MATKRKHRTTGKPKGGKRTGAGRPEGSISPLGLGEVKAVKACNWQVPADAPEDLKALADRAVQRIADVMEEKVWGKNAMPVLLAATRVRELVCGPTKQRHEVSGPEGGALTIEIRKYATEGSQWTAPAAQTIPSSPLALSPTVEAPPPREETSATEAPPPPIVKW